MSENITEIIDNKLKEGIIDGKSISLEYRNELRAEVSKLDPKPYLATILVGDDPASQVYVNFKEKAANDIGIRNTVFRLPADSTQEDVVKKIKELNDNEDVDGILLQLPLPKHLNETDATMTIDPNKDADGLHYVNAGRLQVGMDAVIPCTPWGIMHLLKRSGVNLEGKDAVVIGRSNLVGRPMVRLLESENATVTLCHSRTKNLDQIVKRSDIVVAAVGRPKMVKGEWIKEGAVVIDVGINRVDGKLVGDVEFDEAHKRASLITPVPGGVGPLTVTMLMYNTIKNYKRRRNMK